MELSFKIAVIKALDSKGILNTLRVLRQTWNALMLQVSLCYVTNNVSLGLCDLRDYFASPLLIVQTALV